MNVSRYTARGTIQRKGIAATSCVRWVVTASKRTEAQAASANQIRRKVQPGAVYAAGSADSSNFFITAVCLLVRHAVSPQMAAKPTNPADQAIPCVCEERFGSTRNG